MPVKHRIFIVAGFALFSCLSVLGAEFNAIVLATLTESYQVRLAPVWLTGLLTALFAALPLLWFFKRAPVHILPSLCAYIAAIIMLALGVAYFSKIWVSPAGAVLAIVLAYPLWHWITLCSAQSSLDHALNDLQNELARLGMEQEADVSQEIEDIQQARIIRLATTVKHLRDMHKSRSDTLVFVSHDIRAPLGAAMQLMDKFERSKYTERMQHLLGRAHKMAEGFLQASRAEMSDVNQYRMLEMVGLAQQAVDDCYELMEKKKINLEMDFPADAVWVRGDFSLLLRAVTNILLNAVNYSPAGSVIKVVIDQDDVVSRLTVTDQGPGIPEDKIEKLFKRFSRLDGEYQNPDGSGLGLYFVDITVRKHRGTVVAQNKNRQGAEFVITLPLERRKSDIAVAYDRRVKPQPAFDDSI